MSYDFFALKLSRREYELLVRLLGHHTTGGGLDRVFSELMDGRPDAATIADNKGPLCKDTPTAAKVFYGNRPVVEVE